MTDLDWCVQVAHTWNTLGGRKGDHGDLTHMINTRRREEEKEKKEMIKK